MTPRRMHKHATRRQRLTAGAAARSAGMMLCGRGRVLCTYDGIPYALSVARRQLTCIMSGLCVTLEPGWTVQTCNHCATRATAR